jgi:teichuronic acid biosynthesis glycosyltransferase TuaC
VLILHVINCVSIDELKYFYSAADLLLLTSFHEGSPNVIKEAMACNCPIVSTNVGDVPEVIGKTEGCFLASFDPIDVAEKMRFALEFAQTKGRTNGRQRIIELGLDSETVSAKIIEVYNKVLNIEN